jgi:hypothetical protein
MWVPDHMGVDGNKEADQLSQIKESETAQHVMCECPVVAWIRLERFEKGFTIKRLRVKNQNAYWA